MGRDAKPCTRPVTGAAAFLRSEGRKPAVHQSLKTTQAPGSAHACEVMEDEDVEDGWQWSGTVAASHSGPAMQKDGMFEPDDPYKTVRGEINLWRAVITQAVTDAVSQSAKKDMQYEKSQARCWLEGRTQDFHTVCYYAGRDPNYVREHALRVIEERTEERKPDTTLLEPIHP